MIQITGHDALLIIDVQNDFLPGGPLAVPDGDAVVPVINHLTRLPFGQQAASQDWHPPGHASFAGAHPKGAAPAGTWPDHCIAGTRGAALAASLDQTRIGLIVRKGRAPDVDSYSAFLDNDRVTRTGLEYWLSGLGIRRVFVAGLALDYCVAFTAIDAKTLGFDTFVVEDACRGIAPAPDATWRTLGGHGIHRVRSGDLAGA
ncbi:bifunctional nicotinamidase/pyrazinamidase [Gluconacetobacter azotocaptans]|uniref:nicotinamidase n=1 Tax=Gluconacetobacter azotocaptans TaxID=142834 RepID=A0A7W4JTG8_9PROT|nr:bifunctional nicotinamidase/pyrazinamidase [Gluconacetobacter azotocaptans]MBB2190592.1 bifunctional nicotinamidase/pyrazinamidase [Gluconacetobacter azotocaptans]GBQ26787.1 nicotinamidase [Gluconacetobacter azotocaptans DSM 13594]